MNNLTIGISECSGEAIIFVLHPLIIFFYYLTCLIIFVRVSMDPCNAVRSAWAPEGGCTGGGEMILAL